MNASSRDSLSGSESGCRGGAWLWGELGAGGSGMDGLERNVGGFGSVEKGEIFRKNWRFLLVTVLEPSTLIV